MELYEREFLISRIRARYIPIKVDNKRVKVYHPNIDIKLLSEQLYIHAYKKAIKNGLFDDDDIYNILVMNDLWTEEDEKNYNDVVPKHIEYWKKELYRSTLKSNTRENIRKYLATAKKEYVRLNNMRHHFDHMTCNGYASYVKNMFIISKTTKYRGKRVDWKNFDLNKVMSLYYENMLSQDIIRELARTHPWASMWSSLKTNGKIFDNTDLTSEQQSLISWSSMYDNIHESPDCPTDEAIEDDDMLDGWLLIQKEKRDKDRKKQEVENATSSKIANADDIFIMAETPDDAKKIALLNDQRAQKVKKQRLSQINEQGVVPEQRLSDVKQKQRMLAQQAYIKQVKGK